MLFLAMEYQNSNFKIGLSLFGLAEKYTEQSTHCANHNVTKNHRMYVAGPQIFQMNRQINSFQNICDML